jgi:nitronate monooxygenase
MRMLKSSPSLRSNIKPNCEALGYLLDKDGYCPYQDAWKNAEVDAQGVKKPISEKMCICYHFMRHQCYTCGHYVYRLKETTQRLPNGEFYLPPMEHMFQDYMASEDYAIRLPEPPADEQTTVNGANGAKRDSSLVGPDGQPVTVAS